MKQTRSLRTILILSLVGLAALLSATLIAAAGQGSPFGVGCQPSAHRAAAALLSADAVPMVTSATGGSASGLSIAAQAYGLPPADDPVAGLYPLPSVRLDAGAAITFSAMIPVDGEYIITFDAAVPAEVSGAEGRLTIDGALPLADLQRVIFPVYYRNGADTFPRDRYGNDALIEQVRAVRWSAVPARDVNFAEAYPLRVPLSAGERRFTFTLTDGAVYLGSTQIAPFTPYPAYVDYRAAQTAPEITDFALTIEAELPTYKNDTAVRPAPDRGLTVTPYDTYCQVMNVLGGESWLRSGTAAYYAVSAPRDGLYALTLRALQNTRPNFTVFRRITINGVVPFAELNAVPFDDSTDWLDVTLGGADPYRIFLRQGVNVIGIEATHAPYLRPVHTIEQALVDINALALEIRRLTGNQRDVFREWEISDYIPDLQTRLLAIADALIADNDTLLAIDQGGRSREALTYQMAIDNLHFLASNPNDIPIYLSRFSEGTGSAAQLLGSLLPLLQNQPLAIDRITIHAPDSIPVTPPASVFAALGEGIKRFLYSFQPDPYRSLDAGADELEVWVNRPRQYVNLLQLLADTRFTPETGIRVRFSIMPDESRLVLANAAGIQPDVALGVSTNVPYELAIRNALYDLRAFPDFDSFIRVFAPGALLGYIIDDSVYALPETQDFWVTFYRQDILDSLGLPVPDTWPEVIELLPELQRYGLNYNTPLSSGSGQRNYLFTAPYLFNYDAPLYSDDGFATGLQSEAAVAAVRFMADSFTLYGMPLTTASFFESFRYGTLPIGISNLQTYVQLTIAAPELGGRWAISPYPATILADGSRNRWTTGSAQTSLIFRNTDQPDEAWAFLRWWLSTPTQVEFAEQLTLNYGQEYLWFSANLAALPNLDIPAAHRTVIAEQWQWVQEPARLPGSYMQERELSNIWSRIVFDGVNPRVAIDRSVITINREITRRMTEFGYLVDGERVRRVTIPTVEMVRGWIDDAD